jgi:transcriptional regulator with XRE-family HTH domain
MTKKIDIQKVRDIIFDSIRDLGCTKVKIGEILEDPSSQKPSGNENSRKGSRINRANRFLSGEQKHITLDQINKLAKYTNIIPSNILGIGDSPNMSIDTNRLRDFVGIILRSQNIPLVTLGEVLEEPGQSSISTNPASAKSVRSNRAKRFLSGEQKNITLDQVNRMAEFFQIDADELLGLPPLPPDPNAHRIRTNDPNNPYLYSEEEARKMFPEKYEGLYAKPQMDAVVSAIQVLPPEVIDAIRNLPHEKAVGVLQVHWEQKKI